MINIGDLVRVKPTNIYGVVADYVNMFDVCQEIDSMLVVSINNSGESKVFKKHSIEKVDKAQH